MKQEEAVNVRVYFYRCKQNEAVKINACLWDRSLKGKGVVLFFLFEKKLYPC